MPSYPTTDDAVMALEAPLRYLAQGMSRDELESMLEDCLDDVYEGEDD